MLKAGFIGAEGRSQDAHYPSVNHLEVVGDESGRVSVFSIG